MATITRSRRSAPQVVVDSPSEPSDNSELDSPIGRYSRYSPEREVEIEAEASEYAPSDEDVPFLSRQTVRNIKNQGQTPLLSKPSKPSRTSRTSSRRVATVVSEGNEGSDGDIKRPSRDSPRRSRRSKGERKKSASKADNSDEEDLIRRLTELGVEEPGRSSRPVQSRPRLPSFAEEEMRPAMSSLPLPSATLKQLQHEAKLYRDAKRLWHEWRNLEGDIDRRKEKEKQYEKRLNRLF